MHKMWYIALDILQSAPSGLNMAGTPRSRLDILRTHYQVPSTGLARVWIHESQNEHVLLSLPLGSANDRGRAGKPSKRAVINLPPSDPLIGRFRHVCYGPVGPMEWSLLLLHEYKKRSSIIMLSSPFNKKENSLRMQITATSSSSCSFQ